MSFVTDILDRLSGIAVLRDKLIQQDKVVEQMQRIVLEQQKDLAEVRGQLKALIALTARP